MLILRNQSGAEYGNNTVQYLLVLLYRMILYTDRGIARNDQLPAAGKHLKAPPYGGTEGKIL